MFASIFMVAYVISVVVLCLFVGIILGSWVVTTGMATIDVKLSPVMRKAIVLVVAASAGYLGMVLALTRSCR